MCAVWKDEKFMTGIYGNWSLWKDKKEEHRILCNNKVKYVLPEQEKQMHDKKQLIAESILKLEKNNKLACNTNLYMIWKSKKVVKKLVFLQ